MFFNCCCIWLRLRFCRCWFWFCISLLYHRGLLRLCNTAITSLVLRRIMSIVRTSTGVIARPLLLNGSLLNLLFVNTLAIVVASKWEWTSPWLLIVINPPILGFRSFYWRLLLRGLLHLFIGFVWFECCLFAVFFIFNSFLLGHIHLLGLCFYSARYFVVFIGECGTRAFVFTFDFFGILFFLNLIRLPSFWWAGFRLRLLGCNFQFLLDFLIWLLGFYLLSLLSCLILICGWDLRRFLQRPFFRCHETFAILMIRISSLIFRIYFACFAVFLNIGHCFLFFFNWF